MEGVDATISAWTADQCGRSLGERLLLRKNRENMTHVRAARGRKSGALSEFATSFI